MEKYFCAVHLRRAGIEVPATAVIEGEAMCTDCFKGKAIRPEEEYLGLMNFLPRLDRRKKIRAQSHWDEQSPMSKASLHHGVATRHPAPPHFPLNAIQAAICLSPLRGPL